MRTVYQMRTSKNPKLRVLVALIFSTLIHAIVLILGVLLHWFLPEAVEPAAKKEVERPFELTVQEEVRQKDPVIARVMPTKPAPIEVEKEKVKEEEPEKIEEKAEPVPELPPKAPDMKAVIQETNDEVPDQTTYMSDSANKVEEETRAEDVTLAEVEPGKAAPEPEPQPSLEQEQKAQEAQEAMTMEAAREAQQAQESQEAQTAELAEDVNASESTVKPSSLFRMNMAQAESVIGRKSQDAREEKVARKGPRLLANFEQSQEALKASLENFIYEIKPGNHTAVNAVANPAASYLARVHNRIHVRWADDYLMYLDTQVDRSSPLQDSRLLTILEYVIDAETGAVERVNIVKTSGNLQYDAAAVTVSMAAGPHPSPPSQAISHNGKVYIHWQFARDQRQCGTYGASIFLLHKEG